MASRRCCVDRLALQASTPENWLPILGCRRFRAYAKTPATQTSARLQIQVRAETEGRVAQLKFVKRQIHRRAKFDLLPAGLIGAVRTHALVEIASKAHFGAEALLLRDHVFL